MGKALIIKDADFSANGFANAWYVTELTDLVENGYTFTNNADVSVAGFSIIEASRYQGKTINAIRFNPATAGTLSLCRTKNFASTTFDVIASIVVGSSDINKTITKFFDEVYIEEDDLLFISLPSDTCVIHYRETTPSYISEIFFLRCGKTNAVRNIAGVIAIDLGCIY
jgi:hypothetical protein